VQNDAEIRDNAAMARAKRIPSGGRRRDRELNDFGRRFELALRRSEFPTKRAFLEAADIGGSQFDRYCVVGGTIPNIEQVQRWAELLKCRINDLVPDPAPSPGSTAIPYDLRARANADIERLIVAERCSDEEADLLRAVGGGPMRISYFVAQALLLDHRNIAGTLAPAPAPSTLGRKGATRRRSPTAPTKK
jgi:hypothetical protein